MDFGSSSHRLKWLFTSSKLNEVRRALQQDIVDRLRRQRSAADPGALESGSGTKMPRDVEDPPVVPLLDELRMLKYYQQIIQEKCREMRMPEKVMATAIQFHKRFFLRNTSMEHDPGWLMITAIFCAAKIEEAYTRASNVAGAFNVSEDLVLKHEVKLIEGLDFDLVVHSPYRALFGIIQELKDARIAAAGGRSTVSNHAGVGLPQLPPLDEALLSGPQTEMDSACRAARRALDALMLSDAPLLYTPAELAAAALRSGFMAKDIRIPGFLAQLAIKAAADLRESEEDDKVTVSLEERRQDDPITKLTAILDDLDRLGSEGVRRVEVDEVKEANAAARQWRNLLKDMAGSGMAGAAGKEAETAGDDTARAAKRVAKKVARADAKAKEAEFLGLPQRQ